MSTIDDPVAEERSEDSPDRSDPFVVIDPIDPLPPMEFGRVRQFLAYASGSVPQVLRRCPADVPAQMGLGLVIVSVGVIAGFSMTHAVSTGLGASLPVALAIGALWGAIIFNLDRWLVASSRKMPNFFADLAAIAPRVFLAVLLGFIISEPLVLRVFQSAIETQLAEDRAIESAQAAERLVESQERIETLTLEMSALREERAPVPEVLASKRDEITQLRAEIDEAKAALDAAELELTVEIEGLSATGQSGCGPACRVKTQNRDAAAAEFDRVRDRNESLIDTISAEVAGLEAVQLGADEALQESNLAQIAALEQQVDAIQNAANEAFDSESEARDAGILERIRALHHLEQKDSTLKYAHWALALMFIALDTLPVFAKFMNNRGKPRAYDMLLASEEERVKASVDDRSRVMNSAAEIHTDLLKDEAAIRRDLERQNTQHYLTHAAAAQRSFASAVIQDWERTQKERLLSEQMEHAMRDGTIANFVSWMKPTPPPGDEPDGDTPNGADTNGSRY